MLGDDFMRVNILGDTKVPQYVADMYVSELLKAHPEKRVSSVDLIVDGDFLKVKCNYVQLPNIA